jgi:hypothetical protein
MGFLDKAKQLAEQAQQKLDEAQKNFNQGGSTAGEQPSGVRYDEHGRPIEDAPPAGTAPPPSGQPPAEAAPPPAEPQASEPAPEPPAAPGPTPETGGDRPNSSPDPFKPLDQ